MKAKKQKDRKKHSLVAWVKQHKKISTTIGVILLFVGTGAAAWFLGPTPAGIGTVLRAEQRELPDETYFAPLTGLPVSSEEKSTQAVTAVMLENSPDARPQSGLKKSEVVYEAIAEGGITRFLALYQQQKPSLIGPVRSVRMYYVDWLAPYDASVAHVGGSAAALKEVRNGSYRDIDQFFNESTYWRASDRYAPHNVYTSFERIDALNKQKGFTSSSPKVFARESSAPAETQDATSISVTMSSSLYNSSYKYNADNNTYARSQGGAPHTDREDGRITPKVVIVVKSNMKSVMEDGWREQYQTTGSGEAVIFQNGTATKATWNKKDRASQMTFTNADGETIPLARGQTWISVIPTSSGAVSWQ